MRLLPKYEVEIISNRYKYHSLYGKTDGTIRHYKLMAWVTCHYL